MVVSKRSIEALAEEKLKDGNEYEALQLFRGLAARKTARGDSSGSVAVAEEGAALLLRRGWVDAATDLACQMVDVMLDSQMGMEEGKPRIEHLYSLYEQILGGKVSIEGKGSEAGIQQAAQLAVKFMKSASRWAVAAGPRATGSPDLSLLVGRAYCAAGDLDRCIRHLVAADAPKEVAETIVSLCAAAGAAVPSYESDVRFTHAVLSFLALSNLRDANELLSIWKSTCGTGGSKGAKLRDFCAHLCKTCEYDAPPVFQKLVQVYEGSLIQHAELMNLLKQIGKVYFNIHPPPSPMESLLSMLGAG